MTQPYDCSELNDNVLIAEVKRCVGDERKVQAEFLARLGELDDRQLFAKQGFSSLFDYCTRELHLSEGATYRRIQAMRTARKYPLILDLIRQGKIHLAAVSVLGPILTAENHQELLRQACHKTKRQVEAIRATYDPKPDAPDRVRRLPKKSPMLSASPGIGDSATFQREDDVTAAGELFAGSPGPSSSDKRSDLTPARREQITPLSESRFKVQFTGSERVQKKLQRAQELLRHTCPAGRLEDIFEAALDALLDKKDPERRIARRLMKMKRAPRNSERRAQNSIHSRHIPQHVKDHVWQRDGGRCSYISPGGRQCAEQGGLEYDHVQPWALGGCSDDSENIQLLCRLHNRWRARKTFGQRAAKSRQPMSRNMLGTRATLTS